MHLILMGLQSNYLYIGPTNMRLYREGKVVPRLGEYLSNQYLNIKLISFRHLRIMNIRGPLETANILNTGDS